MQTMNDVVDHLLSVEQFCTYLGTQGFSARRSTGEEMGRLRTSRWDRSSRCLTIEDSPVSLISIQMRGWTGPLQNLRAGAIDLRVGPLPVLTRHVLPMQFHYIVDADARGRGGEIEARLELVKHGWWKQTLHGIIWRGGALAKALNRDADVGRDLLASLQPDEALEIVADQTSACVRIVHKCTRVMESSVLATEMLEIEQMLAPPGLLRAIEGIARRLHERLDG